MKRTFITVLVTLCALAMIEGITYRADAAALLPPAGWYPSRERMNYALGRVIVSVGAADGTTKIAAVGITATDHVLGITNLSDPSETQIATTAVTAGTDVITFASGSTNAEYYQVIYLRPRGDWSN